MRFLILFLIPLAAEGSLLGALHKTLSHYTNNDVSDDVLFGVVLAEAQLKAAKSVNPDIVDSIDLLLEKCQDIKDQHPRYFVNDRTVNRIHDSLQALKTGKMRALEDAATIPYQLEFNLYNGTPDKINSTFCIMEALMSRKVSDDCLNQMADTNARGHTLAHQALYYSVAASILPLEFVQDSIQARCQKMRAELDYAREALIPNVLESVVVEQVAVCGLSRYREFLTEEILQNILALQLRKGCFATYFPQTECEDHLSAVSLVALANFIYAEGL